MATAYHAGFKAKTVSLQEQPPMALRRGIAAVDPKIIPLGTRLYIEDPNGKWNYGYAIAGDTRAIKGNRIDICLDTYAEAIQFGRRTLKVYILNNQNDTRVFLTRVSFFINLSILLKPHLLPVSKFYICRF